MSRKKTRHAISINDELYVRISEFSRGNRIPMSQLVAQAVEAVMGGAVELRPAARSHDIGLGTLVMRGILIPLEAPMIDSRRRVRSYRRAA